MVICTQARNKGDVGLARQVQKQMGGTKKEKSRSGQEKVKSSLPLREKSQKGKNKSTVQKRSTCSCPAQGMGLRGD